MFGWEFPPHQTGGLATATSGLVKGLLGCGVRVTLVVPFPGSPDALPGLRIISTSGRHAALRRYRVPANIRPYVAPHDRWVELGEVLEGTRGSRLYGEDLLAEVERFAAVAGLIASRERHDVIDCHDWITFAAGLAARRVSGRPLVAHMHATERDRSGVGRNEGIVRREAEGLHRATRVICNSHRLKRQVVADYGVNPERVDVVHWGIDEASSHPESLRPGPFPPEDPVVLFIGRVTFQKGPDHFVEVARRVSGFIPEARFVVAGTGDMLPGIIEQTVASGLADRMHFAGGLAGPEVERAFRMARVCVMPSVSEPFGLVALECLRSGTPCIIPRSSGVAEVVQNAFRADFWDIEAMADRIVAILRHPELHEELRRRGLAEVATPRFTLEEAARRTIDVYRRVLAMVGGNP